MPAEHRDNREPGAQRIQRRHVAVEQSRIEREIGQRQARQMHRACRPVRKDEPRRIDAARCRLAAEVFGHQIVVAMQPEHRTGRRSENAHPGIEQDRLDLVAVVEGRQHRAVFRESPVGATAGGGHRRVVAGWQVAMRQPGGILDEEITVPGRQHDPVGNHIVDETGTAGAGETEEGRLHRRRSPRHDIEPMALGLALRIDQDLDPVGANPLRGGIAIEPANVDVMVETGDQPCVASRCRRRHPRRRR